MHKRTPIVSQKRESITIIRYRTVRYEQEKNNGQSWTENGKKNNSTTVVLYNIVSGRASTKVIKNTINAPYVPVRYGKQIVT